MSSEAFHQEDSQSYKSIFKATTLFGGVKVYQIIMQVVRSKFIAVLLGTAGMGIQGLYQSAIGLVQGFTTLGLSQSAVRDVSEANGSGDLERAGRTVLTVRRLTWLTGLLGMVMIILFSPLLSKTTFGSSEYIFPLIVLSCIPLMDQLSAGEGVVLQGMRRLKDLAKASTIGVTLGVLISVPLFYFLGIKGIIPNLILSSLTGLCINYFFSRRVSLPRPPLTGKETWTLGKSMVKMGIAMSVSGVFSTITSYVIRSYIMHQGGAEQVGLFQAGSTIIGSYVGMVFSAIGTDFYPRLAAVNKDDGACRRVISQQGEIAAQILAPILCICTLTMPFVLWLLYSDQFMDATPFVLWSCPGMMLRLASWLVAYQFVAKAESVVFIITEIVGGFVYTIVSLLGYKWGGLTGLGIAFTVDYALYFVFVFSIAVWRYRFSFSVFFVKSFLLQMAFVLGALLAITLLSSPLIKYLLCGFITLSSCVVAVVLLDKRIGLVNAIKEKMNEMKNKRKDA